MTRLVDATRALVMLPLLASQALGQRDSTPADSSARPIQCIECAGYLLMLSIGAFVFAPTAILLTQSAARPDYDLSRRADDGVAFTAEGRVIGDTAQTGGHSENLQWSWHGTFVELRLATWYIPQTFQYQTVRVGRFVQPNSVLSGGVTIGYQRAPRDWTQEGPEVAFPLVIGNERVRLRPEASYVLSAKRVNISYRCQADARIFGGPLWVGADFELKSVREPTPFTGGISLVLGIRR